MMNMLNSKTLLSAAIMVSTGLIQAHADVALTYSNPENPNQDLVLTVSGNRAAMLIPDGQGNSSRMVYDQAENKLYMVMDDQNQYMDMDAMMQSLGGLSDMLAGAMKNMPEESKGQLGDLFGGMLGNNNEAEPAPAPSITSTGQTDSVVGIDCEMFTMQAAGETSEMCLATPGDAGVSDADFQVLQSMMEKQAEVGRKAGEMIGMRGMEFSPGKLNGVPLRIEQVTGSNAGSRSELKSTGGTIDSAVVVIPSDYTPAQLLGN